MMAVILKILLWLFNLSIFNGRQYSRAKWIKKNIFPQNRMHASASEFVDADIEWK
jgi:hypothetical protein